MKVYVLAAALSASLMIQGCSSVVLPTVATLNTVSPLEADPAGFEIASDLPEGTDVQVGGAFMIFDMTRSDTNETLSKTYKLQRRTSTNGRVLFRIHPSDLASVRAFQATAAEWENIAPQETSGSISMSVTACKTGAEISPNATFSVSIRTVVDGPFLPLLRDVSIAEALNNLDVSPEDATRTLCD